MKRSGYEILVSGAFYDALDGDFTPKCDPKNRNHTMGRLMLGSIAKGKLDVTDHGYTHFDYEPSWSDRVKASVGCMALTDNILRIDHINLCVDDELGFDMVSFTSHSHATGHSRLTIVGPKSTNLPVYELELIPGPNLQSVRNSVSRAAQQFFDNIN